ncbi:MAG: putative addiction module antidote protein [Coriobacteriia bacterium]|nr:putative addiction module antidote protein [Coriobacteriia bacterium]
MAVKLTRFDASEYLETEEDIAAYLDVVLADNDPQLLNIALGNIARARGMTEIANRAGVSRESLYRSLSADGNPSAATLLKIVKALGIQLHAAPAKVDGSTEIAAAG